MIVTAAQKEFNKKFQKALERGKDTAIAVYFPNMNDNDSMPFVIYKMYQFPVLSFRLSFDNEEDMKFDITQIVNGATVPKPSIHSFEPINDLSLCFFYKKCDKTFLMTESTLLLTVNDNFYCLRKEDGYHLSMQVSASGENYGMENLISFYFEERKEIDGSLFYFDDARRSSCQLLNYYLEKLRKHKEIPQHDILKDAIALEVQDKEVENGN